MENLLEPQVVFKAQENWRNDPVGCSKTFFGSRLWAKQEETMLAVRDHPKVSVKSGNTVGKSRIAAEIAQTFLLSHYPSKVIITAPTFVQVEEILWKEIAGLYYKSSVPIGGDLLNTELKLNEEWFALGISTNDINRFQGFHCFSEDTEILTKRGWLGIDEISLDDNCLSVKVNTNKAEWKPIKNIHKFPFEGYLNCYKDRVLNFAITDEHRFPTKYDSSSKEWSLKKFNELKTKFVIQRKLSWKGNDIKVPKEFNEMSPKEFAEFIGFWTGDGGTRKHSTSEKFYEVIFYQKKESGCEYLVNNLLKKFKFSKKRDYYSISNWRICHWLINNIGRYGINRVVPSIILNSTPEIIMSYLTGLWKAEGTLRKNGEWGQLYNTSKKLMDGVQELLLKLGRPSTLGINLLAGKTPLSKNTCYVISFTSSSVDSVILKKNVKREFYQGRVWCISTEYETFVARRNGQIFVSGNSPYLLVIVDEALGIDPMIWEAIEGLHPYRVLAIGNPLQPTGHFFDCFSNPLWHKITISCLECVDWQKRNGRIPGLVTQQWIDERREEWGISSPLYQARVLGEFPQEGTDTLIHLDWVDKCRITEIEEEDDALKIVSTDVARFGCFDNKTEILTDKGFMLFENLMGDEKVLSLDLSIDKAKWMPITQIHKYAFDGYLNELVGRRGVDFCITDNHNLIVASPKSNNFMIKRLDNTPLEFKIKRGNDWDGDNPQTIEFISNKSMPNGGNYQRRWLFDFADWAEFLGWFISEGNVYIEKRLRGRCRILISQINKQKIEIIRQLIERMGFNYRHKNNQFEICNNEIGKHLIEYCKQGAENKRCPIYIKNASKFIIEKFLYSFSLGDGYRKKNGGIDYYSSSKLLMDDLQECLIKLGRCGKLTKRFIKGTEFKIKGRKIVRENDVYYLYETINPTNGYIVRNKIRKKKYKGFIYCVSTPLKTIMARRNGVCMWSGNSDKTVFIDRRGHTLDSIEIKEKIPTTQTAGIIKKHYQDYEADNLVVDDSGVGGGTVDILSEQKIGVIPFNGGSRQKAIDKNHFVNLRSQFYWYIARKLEKELYSFKKVGPHLFEKLKNQLCAIKYIIDSSGRIKVESKEDMRARGLPSPDIADTWMMSEYAYFCGRMNEVRPYLYR